MLARFCTKLRGAQIAKGPEVQFQWAPAHAEVEGNEWASKLTEISNRSASGDSFHLRALLVMCFEQSEKIGPGALGKNVRDG